MKMATWRQLIRATSDRITDADWRIERQRQLIDELNREGHDATMAIQALFALMNGNQLLRERLQGLTENMPGCARRSVFAGKICASTQLEKQDV
jgi:hypothetical protein